MPALQVVPANPNFGTQLAQALQQGLGTVAQGLTKRYENKRADLAMKTFSDPNATTIDKAKAFMSLPEEYQKHAGPVLASVLGPQANMEAGASIFNKPIPGTANQSGIPSQNPETPGVPQPTITEQLPEQPKVPDMAQNQAQPPPATQQVEDIHKPHTLSDSTLTQMQAVGGPYANLAKAELDRRETQKKAAQPHYEQLTKDRLQIQRQRNDLRTGWNAVKERGGKGITSDTFARMMGPLWAQAVSKSGGQLDAAMKGFTIGDLGEVTGQKNMWLDKMVRDAQASLDKSDTLNETLILGGMARLDLEELRDDTKSDLLDYYMKNGVAIPSNIEETVDKIIKPQATKIQNKLAYDTRAEFEKEQGEKGLRSLAKVPQGTYLTKTRRNYWRDKLHYSSEKMQEKAKELGYEIPSNDMFSVGQ